MTSFKGLAAYMGLVVVGIILGLFLVEGASRFVLPHWRDFYSGRFMVTTHVPGYGVTAIGRPGFNGFFAQNNGNFRVKIAINNFGLRNSEAVAKADGRVWFIGDSFTFGWGVEQHEMFSAVAGKELPTATYNVASPGTDVCGYQALAARMPKTVRPLALVVGLVLENDVLVYKCRENARKELKRAGPESQTTPVGARNLKRILTGNSALYNLFAVVVKRVPFIRDAMIAARWIKKKHAYKVSLTDANLKTAIERTSAEIRRLAEIVPAGTPIAVLIVPSRFEIRDNDPFYRTLRLGITETLARTGIPVIDPIASFKKAGFAPTHFAHDGHWSVLGHKIAGKAVARFLERSLSPQ